MTAGARFALRGEDEDHEEEQLWALCEEAENLFADPPEPPRRRYELLGCAWEGELPAALGFLVLKPLDEHGTPLWEWYLEDARVLSARPSARDLSRLDVTIEAVRSEQQPRYPQRVALSVGFSLSDVDDRLLGCFRDLAEVLPVAEPEPHPVRLLGCSLHGPLRDVVEGRRKRRLAYRHLDALDTAGAVLSVAGHPDIVDWEPSPRGPGLYDLTVHMDPQPPVVAGIWPLWREGRPAVPNLWAGFDASGRARWLDPALHHRPGPDRPAGATYHLDGRHVTDYEGFFCALGEAVNGPGVLLRTARLLRGEARRGRPRLSCPQGGTAVSALPHHEHMNETEQLLEQVADRVRHSVREHGKPLPVPLAEGETDRAERVLGFALPPLLAALYTRVGDGGFGPEYGLLPLRQAIAEYEGGRGSDWGWPEGVLPIADLGCAMYACVDCRSGTARMLLFEPNPGAPDLAWYHHSPSLAGWLRDWLDGTGWFREEWDEDQGDLDLWAEFSSRCRS